jgi:hypothetical protein
MKPRSPREFLRTAGDIFSPEEFRLALNWLSYRLNAQGERAEHIKSALGNLRS